MEVNKARLSKRTGSEKFEIQRARCGGRNFKKGTDDKADAVVIARAGEFILKNQNNKGFLTEKIILTE